MSRVLIKQLKKLTFLAVFLFITTKILIFKEEHKRDNGMVENGYTGALNLNNINKYKGKDDFKSSLNGVNISSYKTALERYASPSSNKWIILTFIDGASLQMAYNFYVTSLLQFNIHNYLFISSDENVCEELNRTSIHCYVYVRDPDSDIPAMYQQSLFTKKMNYRTYMILDALNLGYSILHSDADVIFFKNPFKEFVCGQGCDMAPLWDMKEHNAGFIFIRNTPASQGVYNISSHIANTEDYTDDQTALNRAISQIKDIQVDPLPKDKYLCGHSYFTKKDTKCPQCVVVHNNFIVGLEAKVYRFKEAGLWKNDNGEYYSATDRKYIIYENLANQLRIFDQLEALQNALAIGDILNRTVILPTFSLSEASNLNLLYILLIRNFDKYFPSYREHSFLSHYKVPVHVKNSVSNISAIITNGNKKYHSTNPNHHKKTSHYFPKNMDFGANSEEIVSWFGEEKASILRFKTLHSTFCCFTDEIMAKVFNRKLIEGFKRSFYSQMRELTEEEAKDMF